VSCKYCTEHIQTLQIPDTFQKAFKNVLASLKKPVKVTFTPLLNYEVPCLKHISLCIIKNHNVKMYGEDEVKCNALSSALVGGEQSASHPSYFTPHKRVLVPMRQEAACATELI
jgi:hypothetical protein